MQEEEHRDGWRSGFTLVLAISVAMLGLFLAMLDWGYSTGVSQAVIPFLVFLVFSAIPLSILAFWMGSYGARFRCRTTVGIFHRFEFPGKEASDVGGAAKFLGLPGVVVPLIVSSVVTYYQALFLALAVLSLAGHFERVSDTSAYLAVLTGDCDNGAFMIGAVSIRTIFLFAFVISVVVNLAILNRGIRNGICFISRTSSAVVGIVVVLLALLVVSSGATSSGTFLDGIRNAFAFDLSKLGAKEIWVVAAVACMVPILISTGPVQCLSTFSQKEIDVAKYGFAVVGLKIASICFLLVLVISPVFAMWPDGARNAVEKIRQTGYVKFGGTLWFFMGFAALTVAAGALLKPCEALFEGELGRSSKKAVWYTAIFYLFLEVPAYFLSKYGYVQQLFFWGGIVGIGLYALCAFFSIYYYIGAADFWEDFRSCTRMKLHGFMKHFLLIVCPLGIASAITLIVHSEISGKSSTIYPAPDLSAPLAWAPRLGIVAVFITFVVLVGTLFRPGTDLDN